MAHAIELRDLTKRFATLGGNGDEDAGSGTAVAGAEVESEVRER